MQLCVAPRLCACPSSSCLVVLCACLIASIKSPQAKVPRPAAHPHAHSLGVYAHFEGDNYAGRGSGVATVSVSSTLDAPTLTSAFSRTAQLPFVTFQASAHPVARGGEFLFCLSVLLSALR